MDAPSDDPSTPRPARQMGRAGRIACLCILVGLAGVVGWLLWPANPQSLLNEARRALSQSGLEQSSSRRTELNRQAAVLLRRYVARRGPQRTTAQLLLSAALASAGDGVQSVREFPVDQLESISQKELLAAAVLLIQGGQLSLAEQALREALTRSEDRDRTLRVAAGLYDELGREDDVLTCCKELTGLVPDDFRPWLTMGTIYEEKGLTDFARESFMHATRLSPAESDVASMKMIRSTIAAGDTEEARRLFDAVGSGRRESSEWVVLEAKLLHGESRVEEARRKIEQLLVRQPQRADALELLGQIWIGQEEFARAVAVLQRAVQADPLSFSAHYALGQAQARLGDREAAEKTFDRSRQIRKARTEIFRLERQAGREPRNADVRRKLASLHAKLGVTRQEQFWSHAADAASAAPGATEIMEAPSF